MLALLADQPGAYATHQASESAQAESQTPLASASAEIADAPYPEATRVAAAQLLEEYVRAVSSAGNDADEPVCT